MTEIEFQRHSAEESQHTADFTIFQPQQDSCRDKNDYHRVKQQAEPQRKHSPKQARVMVCQQVEQHKHRAENGKNKPLLRKALALIPALSVPNSDEEDRNAPQGDLDIIVYRRRAEVQRKTACEYSGDQDYGKRVGSVDQAVQERKNQIQRQYQRNVPDQPHAVRPKGEHRKIQAEPSPAGVAYKDIQRKPACAAKQQIGRQNARKPLAVKPRDTRVAAEGIEQPHAGQEQEDLHSNAAQQQVVTPYKRRQHGGGVSLLRILTKVEYHNADDGKPEQLIAHIRDP